MGFLPIFLYIGGFLFLFIIVVANSFKSKKEQYRHDVKNLVALLDELYPQSGTAPLEKGNLKEVEKYLQSLKLNTDKGRSTELDHRIMPYLAQAKMHLHWYNKMVRTKPYSFVATMLGYKPI